jgi:hypothetical protein
MNQGADWTVRHASVVLVADHPIETYMLSPEVLRTANVTPGDWEQIQYSEGSSPPLVAYSNGVTISAQDTRCVFNLDLSGQFQENYEIHAVAKRYLAATRIVPYRFIGINWNLFAAMPSPEQWIHSNLLAPKRFFQPCENLEVRMTQPLDFTLCNLAFTTRDGEVVVDCNYHFDLSDISAEAAIDRWKDCYRHLRREVIPSF